MREELHRRLSTPAKFGAARGAARPQAPAVGRTRRLARARSILDLGGRVRARRGGGGGVGVRAADADDIGLEVDREAARADATVRRGREAWRTARNAGLDAVSGAGRRPAPTVPTVPTRSAWRGATGLPFAAMLRRVVSGKAFDRSRPSVAHGVRSAATPLLHRAVGDAVEADGSAGGVRAVSRTRRVSIHAAIARRTEAPASHHVLSRVAPARPTTAPDSLHARVARVANSEPGRQLRHHFAAPVAAAPRRAAPSRASTPSDLRRAPAARFTPAGSAVAPGQASAARGPSAAARPPAPASLSGVTSPERSPVLASRLSASRQAATDGRARTHGGPVPHHAGHGLDRVLDTALARAFSASPVGGRALDLRAVPIAVGRPVPTP